MKGSCNVDKNALTPQNRVKLFEECEYARQSIDTHQSIRQLLLEDGGYDLFTQAQNIPFINMFTYMRPLFNGLIHMEQQNIAHGDIKDQNIIFNHKNKRMLYIDFGLSVHFNKIFDIQRSYHLHYDYLNYPPEHMIAAHVYRNIKQSNPFDLPTFQIMRYQKNKNFIAQQMQEDITSYFHEEANVPKILTQTINTLKNKIKKETPKMLNRWKTQYQALTKNKGHIDKKS